MAIGHGGAFVTADFGQHWSQAALPSDPAAGQITCQSSGVCLAAQKGGNGSNQPPEVFNTQDGGRTWTAYPVPSSVSEINALSCPTASVCYAAVATKSTSTTSTAGGAEVIVSVDGGATWAEEPLDGQPILVLSIGCPSVSQCTVVGELSQQFSSGNDLYSTTYASYVATTLDGGRSWAQSASGEANHGIVDSVVCPTTSNCIADATTMTMQSCSSFTVCSNYDPHTTISSTDGGVTWADAAPDRNGAPDPAENLGYPITCVTATACWSPRSFTPDLGRSVTMTYSPIPSSAPTFDPTAGVQSSVTCPALRQCMEVDGDTFVWATYFGGVFPGYWLTASDGGVFTFGGAGFYGSTGSLRLNQPIVGMAPTVDGNGYWLVAKDGGLFTFGDAPFDWSLASQPLSAPIVGVTSIPDSTSSTGHYVMAASDGTFYWSNSANSSARGRFTTAVVGISGPFMASASGEVANYTVDSQAAPSTFGSMAGKPLNAPIVGIQATPDQLGYWLVAADGGVFCFGDARFYGSTGNIHLNRPIVGMSAPDSGGYWLIASDGGVFSFGDAPFYGSTGGMQLNEPIVAGG